jgi:hypothetical protein
MFERESYIFIDVSKVRRTAVTDTLKVFVFSILCLVFGAWGSSILDFRFEI